MRAVGQGVEVARKTRNSRKSRRNPVRHALITNLCDRSDNRSGYSPDFDLLIVRFSSIDIAVTDNTMLKAAEYIEPERPVPYVHGFLALGIVVPAGFLALLTVWCLMSGRAAADPADVPALMGP